MPKTDSLHHTEQALWSFISDLKNPAQADNAETQIKAYLDTNFLNNQPQADHASLAAQNPQDKQKTFLLHVIGVNTNVALLIIEKLCEYGLYSTLWQADENGVTPLYLAANLGLGNIITALFDKYAQHYPLTDVPNPLTLLSGNETPLHIATQQGHQAVLWQLSKGFTASKGNKTKYYQADLRQLDKAQNTLLHSAACSHNIALVIKLILKFPKDINEQNSKGATPVMNATSYNDVHSMFALQAFGANMNIPMNNKTTLLHLAATRGNLEATQFLLENGFCSWAVDGDGHTPIDYALGGLPDTNIAHTLLQYGAGIQHNFTASNLQLLQILDLSNILLIGSSKDGEIIGSNTLPNAITTLDQTEKMHFETVTMRSQVLLRLQGLINLQPRDTLLNTASRISTEKLGEKQTNLDMKALVKAVSPHIARYGTLARLCTFRLVHDPLLMTNETVFLPCTSMSLLPPETTHLLQLSSAYIPLILESA